MPTPLSYRAGAWSWIACGTGHTVLDIAMRLSPGSDGRHVDAVLRASVLDIGGIARTSYEVIQGISLAMGAAIVVVGVLLLYVGRLASSAGQLRQAALIGLAASAVMLGFAVALLPSPPIVLFSVAVAAFGVTLLRARRRPDPGGTPARPRTGPGHLSSRRPRAAR
ncbi:hypothetical protein [Actinoplanes sp. NPDC026670]|uniref:LIC_13387 family protein n=1 Tax=Actinoplanes sp. NPDC026670 TaxID=3154700 RepID=UPI0033FF75A8